MKHLFILVISFGLVHLHAMESEEPVKNSQEQLEKSTTRTIRKAATKRFMGYLSEAQFITWLQELNRAIITKERQLQKINSGLPECIVNNLQERKKLREEVDDLRLQRYAAKDKLRAIKTKIREDNYGYVQEITQACGPYVLWTGEFEPFPEGYCFDKVLMLLQFQEFKQRAQQLKSEMKSAQDIQNVDQMQKITTSIFSKAMTTKN